MTTTEPAAAPAAGSEREQAVRAVEAEFSELLTQFRHVILRIAQRVSPGMLPGSYKVFTTIVRHGPLTASTMAERLLIDKGQLSRMVRELEELGLVARAPDPSDGRAHLLEATDEGRRRLEAARAGGENSLAQVLEAWPLEDVQRLSELLHALVTGEPPAASRRGQADDD
ncbi:MarR family winged helix-turn-helix transcriptional regulator [Microbacterium album]|uniref:Transcriptional regulator n=1 Tax=Microbacterium album TaxID=2053191 RepID=A0A917MMR9_9MICO|nr:MarR family transcriptional regulator [Microbacterium album]GGH36662.1 transcriptional regulator [Microbacterium album]